MSSLRRKASIWCSLLALPMVGQAQTALSNQPTGTVPTQTSTAVSGSSAPIPEAALVGTPAIDLITLSSAGPGVPLRYGNVVPGSERVEFNGQILTAVTDYALDCGAGVVYLLRPQKSGDSLSVSYRYNSKAAPGAVTSGSSFQGLGSLKYQISPSVNMLMGMGMAERAADGTVLTSNNFGWSNNFSMGSGKLDGLFIVGDRQKQQNSAGLQMDTTGKPGDASSESGSSNFIVQNFRTGLLGGNVGVDYQQVSKNFSGFNQVSAAGYTDTQVKTLTAERGLQREGFSLEGLKFGSLQLSSTEKSVKSGSDSIKWESLGLAQGGLKLNYSAQNVDKTFNRFTDLSEANKAQLQAEAGIDRQDLTGSFDQKVGKMSFESLSIKEVSSGTGINRRDFQFNQGATKLDFGDQDISANFSRFGNLLAPEKATYGREAGLQRQWLALDTAVLGKTNTLSFHEMELGAGAGQFHQDTASYATKTWSIMHFDQSAPTSFAKISALQDAEQDANIAQIASMYGPGNKTSPADRSQYQLSAGLSRSYTAFGAQPFKTWNLNFSEAEIKGTTGAVDLQTGTLATKNVNFTYKHEDYAYQFTQATSLLALEQKSIGNMPGLDRTDYGLAVDLGRNRKFSATRLTAFDPDGNAIRNTAEYSDKKIDVTYAGRAVGSTFETNSQLVDPEATLLTTMRGYQEQDARVKWQILSTMKLDSQMTESKSLLTGTVGEFDNTVFDWAVNKNTQLNIVRQDGRNTDPMNTMFASMMQKISLSENFGKLGKVQFMDQQAQYGIPGSTLPDFHTDYLSYETKVDALTTVKSEQTVTSFGNGGTESIDANTVSRTLSKRAGVSLTDTQITAKGETQQDETKRNYGFWYDIGSGLRISYGCASDQNNGAATSTQNSTLAVGKNSDTINNTQLGNLQQGQAGNLMIGGGYGTNQWDQVNGVNRTQSFSNVGINTAKPMNFGFLKQVTLKISSDTAADYAAWVRENRLMSVAGNIGANTLGFDYRSQMQSNGDQGVDRGIHFASDPNPKNWIVANLSYKERTLPGNQTFAIRDFNVVAKPTKKISISEQLQTNPEVVRTDLILGSLPQASRSNKWKVDYLTDAKTILGGSWEELRNDANSSIARTAGINAKFFANSPSPVTVFYGLQQGDAIGALRHTMQRYSVQFDQKAGPRQSFNLFLGNVSYDNTLDPGKLRNNWTARIDYQFRF